jgi:hypothetical protein
MDDRSFLPPRAAAARFLAVAGLANARDPLRRWRHSLTD